MPNPPDCILVDVPEELRWALTGIAKELGMTSAGVLIMAADMTLDKLVEKAVAARARAKRCRARSA